ncbi:transketolase [Amycolatopsis marina]|uniref:Transketolase n=1 Tax=Amycolatopsis marina TaxID=490629 RepID=A0A1I1AFV5_9PSEU|nr:transketolase [Amycolatopsis marina]SFB36847.1 transketolase [Amycolatopsis marina]
MTATITASMRETALATLDEALDTDPRLAVVLADISADRLRAAAARHPDRVINLGIREQLLVSVAGGLALAGMRPVAHTFASFLVERPFEQVKLDLGHQGAGAVLMSAGASYDMPTAGRTHQSPGDVALLDTLPGWTVHVPGHPAEASELLLGSLPGSDPVYLRLSEASNAEPMPGTGVRRVREGYRGVVLAVGPMLDRTLVATAGLDVTVLYAATVRPFDAHGLRAAVDAAGVADVVLVEPYLVGTSAHLVAEALEAVPHRVRSLGVRRDAEVRVYGSMADHDRAHGLDEATIAGSVAGFLR